MKTNIRRSMNLLLILAILSFFVAPVQAQPIQLAGEPIAQSELSILKLYARDTWRSFEAMIYPETGLPADSVSADGVRAGYTSPTNIGLYVWSTLAARDLQIINPTEAQLRIGRVLEMLETMERHTDSGMYYNWYDPATGAKLTIWPPSGDPIYPFLSSVDNGWLASALTGSAGSASVGFWLVGEYIGMVTSS